jgi:hypothetical protein
METQIWTDWLVNQSPIIVILIIVLYFGSRFFKEILAQRDLVITEKDEKIENHSNKVMELYGKAIEAQTRNTEVQERLIEVIEETSKNVRDLTHVVDKAAK